MAWKMEAMWEDVDYPDIGSGGELGTELSSHREDLLQVCFICVGGVQEGWRGLGGWEEGGEGGGC